MNYKTGLEDFIGKESLSKTLRNALIPTESTKIHMEEMGVIRDDELRAEKQQELKEIMDDYYRAFIEEKLGQIQGIQWNSLFQKMEETMEDISVRKDLDKIQNEKRKEIQMVFGLIGAALGDLYLTYPNDFSQRRIVTKLRDTSTKNTKMQQKSSIH